MNDLKLISVGTKIFTRKKLNPMHKMRTNASTKNKASPETKELVLG
jgi:hypothetical protein